MTQLRQKTGLLEGLARLGYGARGVVYVMVGGLAVLDAVGATAQQSTSTRGALEKLLGEPFGQVLLGLIALGLVGYALWRSIQAVLDVDGHGNGVKGIAIRGGLFVSCLSHIGLAFFTASLIFGWGAGGGGGGDSSTQDWTARLLSQQYGQWLVGLIGVAVIGAGIAQFYKGATAGFEKYLHMGPDTARWATPVGQFGLMARGAVFGIIGGFLIVAALHFSSGEAKGLKGALDTLEAQPYGPWLLGIVAVGLLAFAVYSLVEAFYRRVNPPEPV